MIDILVTTFNRSGLLRKTIDGIFATTKIPFRLFIIDDCSSDDTAEYLTSLKDERIASIVLSRRRNGVVYGFNMLWSLADYHDSFVEAFPYMAYIQDDMESLEDDWISTLLSAYEELKREYNLGFFTGYHAPEHPIAAEIKWREIPALIKTSASACCLFAEKTFWRSIGYVPKLNPDGSPRGFPNNQRGSHIDLYLTGTMSGGQFVRKASAENSSYVQGKRILVLPHLLHHMAMSNAHSTWRSAPEIPARGVRR